LAVIAFMSAASEVRAESVDLEAEVRRRAAVVEGKLIAWRRDIHQHPELGDQQTRTSRLVAEHLRGLGLEVRTGVARTGVGLLKGAKPGRTVSLRADMDALPIEEPEGCHSLPKQRSSSGGRSSASCTPVGTMRIPP
jgi:metal-dependent amidase/aminoacylase/carboxypeptidase family protein